MMLGTRLASSLLLFVVVVVVADVVVELLFSVRSRSSCRDFVLDCRDLAPLPREDVLLLELLVRLLDEMVLEAREVMDVEFVDKVVVDTGFLLW